LQQRAAFVDHTYRTREIMKVFRDEETGDFEQPDVFHDLGMRTVANVLELDFLHPAEWPGNLIQGRHQVSILSTMLQLHPSVVGWYCKRMEEQGIVELEGDSVKLTDVTRQQMVDALEDV
jgi:hypothetical protein